MTYPKGYKPPPRSNKKVKPYKHSRLRDFRSNLILYSSIYWILGISVIITVIVIAVFMHLIGVSFVPIQKNLNIETQLFTREFVDSKKGETLEYLTTGPIFTAFEFYCDRSNWGWFRFSSSLSCLKLSYDGKPGIVELYIKREFPKITQVAYDGPSSYNWPIPYQILREDNYYTKIRIELPPWWEFNAGFNGIVISNSETGPMSYLASGKELGLLALGTFIGSFFLLVVIRYKIFDKS